MGVVVQEADRSFARWNELLALLARCFAYMDGRIDPPSSLARMGLGELAAKAATEMLIVAMDGEALVGCLFLRLDGDCGHVGKLAVDERYRRRGIGRRLLAAAETAAARSGRRALRLQTRIELCENHATFVRLGFVKAGETAHPGYDRPTSITMRKPLSMVS